MDYRARFYSPALKRFIQPDTLILAGANSQAWNRYTYVRNNPIQYNDPSGHKECSVDNNGECDKKEELWNYAYSTLDRLGGKNDLEAMVRIVNKAAHLYQTFDKMIPKLTEIFNGRDESNPLTIINLGDPNHMHGCDGVGRESIRDCPQNTSEESFWDNGFNEDFRDGHNQIFHYWAYLSTGASTSFPLGGNAFGYYIGQVGNLAHEIFGIGDPQGASWQDFALTERALDTGSQIAFGQISPRQLGSHIKNDLSNGTHYVNWLIQNFPLAGNR